MTKMSKEKNKYTIVKFATRKVIIHAHVKTVSIYLYGKPKHPVGVTKRQGLVGSTSYVHATKRCDIRWRPRPEIQTFHVM